MKPKHVALLLVLSALGVLVYIDWESFLVFSGICLVTWSFVFGFIYLTASCVEGTWISWKKFKKFLSY